MLKYHLIVVSITLVASLPGISTGAVVEWTSGDYEIRSNNEWSTIGELHTYNDVTVRMYGGAVHQFYMYDSSALSVYGPGSVDYLYLYENTSVSFFGSTYMNELYIDPASMAQVKLYAYGVNFQERIGHPGEGTIYGHWTGNDMLFNIDLVGSGAYSHIQIVPEPVTLALLGLGGLAVFKRRKL
jgi:hypothetical protein